MSRSRAICGGGGACARRERRKRDRQTIEAVVAPDLLDEVGFARDVDAEARHRRPARSARPDRRLVRDAEAQCRSRIRTTSSPGTAWPSRRAMRDDRSRTCASGRGAG